MERVAATEIISVGSERLWKSPYSPSTRDRLVPSFGRVDEMEDSFEIEAPAREDERLTLDLDGWEGPLDLLLMGRL